MARIRYKAAKWSVADREAKREELLLPSPPPPPPLPVQRGCVQQGESWVDVEAGGRGEAET